MEGSGFSSVFTQAWPFPILYLPSREPPHAVAEQIMQPYNISQPFGKFDKLQDVFRFLNRERAQSKEALAEPSRWLQMALLPCSAAAGTQLCTECQGHACSPRPPRTHLWIQEEVEEEEEAAEGSRP